LEPWRLVDSKGPPDFSHSLDPRDSIECLGGSTNKYTGFAAQSPSADGIDTGSSDSMRYPIVATNCDGYSRNDGVFIRKVGNGEYRNFFSGGQVHTSASGATNTAARCASPV